MGFLCSCDTQTRKLHLGVVLDEEAEPDKLAYVDDDLDGRIADKIGFLS